MHKQVKTASYKWLLNYGILKLPLGILICSLIFEEIMLYAKVKPTASSFSETEMVPGLNPTILICKTPAFDEKNFKY